MVVLGKVVVVVVVLGQPGLCGALVHWQSPGKVQTPRRLGAHNALNSNKEKRGNLDLSLQVRFSLSSKMHILEVLSNKFCCWNVQDRIQLSHFFLCFLDNCTLHNDDDRYLHLAGTIPHSQWRCLCHHLHRISRSNSAGRKEKHFLYRFKPLWLEEGTWVSVQCQQLLKMQSTSGNCVKL